MYYFFSVPGPDLAHGSPFENASHISSEYINNNQHEPVLPHTNLYSWLDQWSFFVGFHKVQSLVQILAHSIEPISCFEGKWQNKNVFLKTWAVHPVVNWRLAYDLVCQYSSIDKCAFHMLRVKWDNKSMHTVTFDAKWGHAFEDQMNWTAIKIYNKNIDFVTFSERFPKIEGKF